MKDHHGTTPISLCCEHGQLAVVRVLLKDPHLDVTLADHTGWTPLWRATCSGHFAVVEWLVASGRDLGVNLKGRHWDGHDYTALGLATKYNRNGVLSVLKRFTTNPAQTRREVRTKLGVLDELAAELFALTVFMCDGLLQLNPALAITISGIDVVRFFASMKRLPMELQMILCRRKDSEPAFKARRDSSPLLSVSLTSIFIPIFCVGGQMS